jgi:hypothetical protein
MLLYLSCIRWGKFSYYSLKNLQNNYLVVIFLLLFLILLYFLAYFSSFYPIPEGLVGTHCQVAKMARALELLYCQSIPETYSLPTVT